MMSILKVHQILSLADIDFEPILPLSKFNVRYQNLPIHFSELLEEFKEFDGINYMQGDGSQDSKIISHACDAKILLDYLIEGKSCKRMFDKSNVQLTGDSKDGLLKDVNAGANGKKTDYQKDMPGKSLVDSQNVFYVQLYQEKEKELPNQKKVDFDVKDDFIILKINKEFFELFIQANGKADLYFHAYFWDKYFQTLQKQISNLDDTFVKGSGVENVNIVKNQDAYPFLKRLSGLANTLQKVILNIKKYPFNQEMYDKFVKEFAKKADMRKQSMLEQVQRSLFVA